MNEYRADLHIHTVLSPCGSLDMSPTMIIEKAIEKGLDIIGITDHNTTRHCKLMHKLAESEGLLVLMGAEITTREEVHCLTFFENEAQLTAFQAFLEEHLIPVANDTEKFGYQLVVDENENVIDEIKLLLISSLDQSIEEIEQKVHSLGGLFIPAHIDRPSFSILSQLGFIPEELSVDGLEISANYNINKALPLIGNQNDLSFIRNSDAHIIEQVGKVFTTFEMEQCSFDEVKLALQGKYGRKVTIG